MAGASAKKTKAANASQLQILQIGFFTTNALHLLAMFIFSSNRSLKLIIYFLSSFGIEFYLWKSLVGISAKQGDLGQSGLTEYMFDAIYVTWFVHVTTALISAKFWYFYLLIPGYVFYRAASFIKGYLAPSENSSLAGTGKRAVKNESPQEEVVTESKRQEKLRLKREKGPIRFQ